MTQQPSKSQPPKIRCAIYTRKSSEEGLEQEFNSLDAQRESGEAFIASMKTEGWICLPDRYDDGGFTGANVERPALQRLLADIAARRIDTVVVYKVDRLSRSLLDFARMMEQFERHGVNFVSVTQQFNTTHSMGRLTLNILLSFAQFEREIISERTRDKVAAARKKGKYTGGHPVLGYDLQRSPSRLIVNETEAAQIRAIFETYAATKSAIETVRELDRRGWTTKRWVTKAGKERGGKPFDRGGLYNLLTNVIYLGKIRHHKDVYEGEQDALVDAELFATVQETLRQNYGQGGSAVRNEYGALLKGILRCAPCGCNMMHSYSAKNNTRYRYYICRQAQKRGWHNCPSKSVSAVAIERLIWDQVRNLDPERFRQIVAANGVESDIPTDVDWEKLTLVDQSRIVRHVVERVDYDGQTKSATIVFRSTENLELGEPS